MNSIRPMWFFSMRYFVKWIHAYSVSEFSIIRRAEGCKLLVVRGTLYRGRSILLVRCDFANFATLVLSLHRFASLLRFNFVLCFKVSTCPHTLISVILRAILPEVTNY